MASRRRWQLHGARVTRATRTGAAYTTIVVTRDFCIVLSSWQLTEPSLAAVKTNKPYAERSLDAAIGSPGPRSLSLLHDKGLIGINNSDDRGAQGGHPPPQHRPGRWA